MKKDVFLKRFYCAAIAVLCLFRIWNDLRDMVLGSRFDTGIILSVIALAWAVHVFFHPEKLNWKAEQKSLVVYTTVISGLLFVAYLCFGLWLHYPDNWVTICSVSGAISAGGIVILTSGQEE